MKRLIIVGAGGFGREILSWVKDAQTNLGDFEIGGFLDDNFEALGGYDYNVQIIGSIQDYLPKKGDCFIMGIASPTRKKLGIAEALVQRGAEFISLIHPDAVIGNNVSIGRGCVICNHSVFTCDIKIGEFVTTNLFVTIGHDVMVNDGCSLHPFVSINGFAQLGKGVEVGSHGCVLPGVKVGDFATVGAGSMVVKYVKPGITVIGVPAKRL